jgi:glycosyltransferase involved in cell wall biosynthesis
VKIALDLRTNRRGGIHRYSHALARALLSHPAGHDWILICHPGDERCTRRLGRENTSVIASSRRERFLRSDPRLCRILERADVDALWTFNYVSDVNAQLPLVVTLHDAVYFKSDHAPELEHRWLEQYGLDERARLRVAAAESPHHPPPLPTQLARDLWRLFARQIDRSELLVVPSQATAMAVAPLFPMAHGKIVVVPGAAERLDSPRLVAAERRRFVADLGVTEPFLLWVGGDSKPYKRLELVLAAFDQLRSRRPEARLVLVGPSRDTVDDRHAVTALGFVSDRQLAALYMRARALIVTSSDEGFCLPAIEATLYGLPVIAPEIPALQESAPGAATYPAGDTDALVERLEDAADRRHARPPSARVPCWASSAQLLVAAWDLRVHKARGGALTALAEA